jgi:RNA polymerase sigma-B factor
MHYVRDHERLVRIPRRIRTLEKRFIAHWDAYTAEHHREPTLHESALALGVDVRTMEELRLYRRAEHLPLPTAGESDGPERLDLLALPDTFSLEDRVALAGALDRLAERERVIVLGTYSVGLTQSELGARLGLSQSHVSKLLARALDKMSRCVA